MKTFFKEAIQIFSDKDVIKCNHLVSVLAMISTQDQGQAKDYFSIPSRQIINILLVQMATMHWKSLAILWKRRKAGISEVYQATHQKGQPHLYLADLSETTFCKLCALQHQQKEVGGNRKQRRLQSPEQVAGDTCSNPTHPTPHLSPTTRAPGLVHRTGVQTCHQLHQ